MGNKLINRQLLSSITNIFRYFSVLTLTGPRQSGKTTLCRKLFAELPYYNLEDSATLAMVQHDPCKRHKGSVWFLLAYCTMAIKSMYKILMHIVRIIHCQNYLNNLSYQNAIYATNIDGVLFMYEISWQAHVGARSFCWKKKCCLSSLLIIYSLCRLSCTEYE